MAATAQKKTTASKSKANVLDTFDAALLGGYRVLSKARNAEVFARVIFATVLASMYDAVNESLPALKADADGKSKTARRQKIENAVLDRVLSVTGEYFTWQTVSTWIDAARVNALLPENLQCKLDGENPVGTFGTYSLRALGRIDDMELRTKMAVDLAKSGDVSQEKVDSAVKTALGEKTTPDPIKPKAAAKMVESLNEKMGKKHAQILGRAQAYAVQIDSTEAVAGIAEFARVLWTQTPSDPGTVKPEARLKKRIKVFTDSLAELLDPERNGDDPDDGIENEEAVQ